MFEEQYKKTSNKVQQNINTHRKYFNEEKDINENIFLKYLHKQTINQYNFNTTITNMFIKQLILLLITYVIVLIHLPIAYKNNTYFMDLGSYKQYFLYHSSIS